MKVLIVDDEELTREGIRMSIPWENLGITEVYMAEDGEEGLKKALELLPDIILADVRMPRMDGITMAFEIRKSWKQCRFIFVSGYCDKAVSYTHLDVYKRQLLCRYPLRHQKLFRKRPRLLYRYPARTAVPGGTGQPYLQRMRPSALIPLIRRCGAVPARIR